MVIDKVLWFFWFFWFFPMVFAMCCWTLQEFTENLEVLVRFLRIPLSRMGFPAIVSVSQARWAKHACRILWKLSQDRLKTLIFLCFFNDFALSPK